MRPTPDETIGGIRRVLSEAVRPHVDSQYARELLDHIVMTLSQFSWDDVLVGMLQENRALFGVLREWQAAAHGGELPADVAEACEADVAEGLEALEVDAAAVVPVDALRFADVHERNLCGRRALERISRHRLPTSNGPTIRLLDAALRDHLRSFPGGGYWRTIDRAGSTSSIDATRRPGA